MRDLLESKLARFEQLEKDLVDQEVLSNGDRLAATAREHGSLAKLATKYRRFKEICTRQISRSSRKWSRATTPRCANWPSRNCPTLRGAAGSELWHELLDMTIGGEDANRARCVMEIRAGTGGDEAALFARDLYDMYKHHGEHRRSWKFEIHGATRPTELGGFKEISLGIEGEGVFRELQYESGGHRVQRLVPLDEALPGARGVQRARGLPVETSAHQALGLHHRLDVGAGVAVEREQRHEELAARAPRDQDALGAEHAANAACDGLGDGVGIERGDHRERDVVEGAKALIGLARVRQELGFVDRRAQEVADGGQQIALVVVERDASGREEKRRAEHAVFGGQRDHRGGAEAP